MKEFALIESRQDVLGGIPVFKNTRIQISLILDMLNSGDSREEIIQEYPNLTVLHIQQALEFASYLTSFKNLEYA